MNGFLQHFRKVENLLLLSVVLLISLPDGRVIGPIAENLGNLIALRSVVAVDSLASFQVHSLDVAGRGWVIAKSLDPERSRIFLEAFLRLHPKHWPAQLELGRVLWDLGQREDALAMWRQIKDTDYYFAHRSASELRQGNDASGLEYTEIAEQISDRVDSNKRSMYIELCQLQQRSSDLTRIVGWCRNAVEVNSSGWQWFFLGTALYRERRLLEAEAALKTALRHSVSQQLDGQIYAFLGHVYLSQDAQRAIEAYEVAYSLGSQDKWVLMGLAHSYRRLGRYVESCVYFGKAVEIGYHPPESERRDFDRCNP